jgi:hypothetical protein
MIDCGGLNAPLLNAALLNARLIAALKKCGGAESGDELAAATLHVVWLVMRAHVGAGRWQYGLLVDVFLADPHAAPPSCSQPSVS